MAFINLQILKVIAPQNCYRFNKDFMKEVFFENLLPKMMTAQPVTHKQLIYNDLFKKLI